MTVTYAVKMGSLRAFLKRVKSKELGVPDKVTQAYLMSIGYKSPNDRRIIPVLKSINFIGDNGVPTQSFSDFRTEKSEQIMATALRKTYADLFKIYSRPLEKDKSVLENFFAKNHPSVKKSTLGLFVDTFKVLCEFADFGAPAIAITPTPIPTPDRTPTLTPAVQLPVAREGGVNLSVNIQLELPATQDATVYDKIFASLKKHLLTPSSKED